MTTRCATRWVALCCALAALLLLPTRAVLAKEPPQLTAMDYIQIQQLVNRLSIALDYCTHGGQDFADLFVPGGQFIIDAGDGKPRTITGRTQLAALAGGPDCRVNLVPPRAYVLHVAESLVIDPAPEGARGTAYAIYPANKGKYFKDDVAGQVGLYHDVYVRTPAGWRFKSRRHEQSPAVGAAATDEPPHGD